MTPPPPPNPSRRADKIVKFGHKRPWDAMVGAFLNTDFSEMKIPSTLS